MPFSRITTVLSPAASYLLTDLATVKDELSIDTDDTANDAWLTRAISQISRSIKRYTKRVFAPELVQNTFYARRDPDPHQTTGGVPVLELSRWPVLQVTSVVLTLIGGPAPQTRTLTEGMDFQVNPDTGELFRLDGCSGVVIPWRALGITVIYTAGYGALVLETGTVSDGQVTVSQAAAWSCSQSVAYADGTTLTLVAANPAQGQFSVANGVYTFNAADDGQLLSFAYATVAIPDDLVDVCLRMITGRFSGKGRDPALVEQTQPNLGTKRWWFGGVPGQKGDFPPDVLSVLDDYRVPTVV
jgi:hypothetical protein